MTKFLIAAAVAALSTGAVAPASAAVVAVTPASNYSMIFEAGKATPDTNFRIVADFNDGTMQGFTTTNAQLAMVKRPPSDSAGAPPASSVPSGTAYLSVLGGGNASYTFAQPVTAFQFDWGSMDSYNTLTVNMMGQASALVIPGLSFPNAANGDQVAAGTNGRFTLLSRNGTQFTGITLTSSSNSFEIDNLAVGSVPEPATWGLMLAGFGLVGAGMRSRRRTATFA